jgi:hypothetical protein
MDYLETVIIEEDNKSRLSKPSDTAGKKQVSGHGAISILAESAIMGFSLLLAFLVQRTYFDLNDHQFLLERGELIRMSMGMVFCYAFVFVLRRGYLTVPGSGRKDIAVRLTRYILESYILYLALLFLVRDINFRSVKLALGIGVVISAVLLLSYGFVSSAIFSGKKIYSRQRKITLKKPPFPSVSGEKLQSEAGIPNDNVVVDSHDSLFDGLKDDEMAFGPAGEISRAGQRRYSEKS